MACRGPGVTERAKSAPSVRRFWWARPSRDLQLAASVAAMAWGSLVLWSCLSPPRRHRPDIRLTPSTRRLVVTRDRGDAVWGGSRRSWHRRCAWLVSKANFLRRRRAIIGRTGERKHRGVRFCAARKAIATSAAPRAAGRAGTCATRPAARRPPDTPPSSSRRCRC